MLLKSLAGLVVVLALGAAGAGYWLSQGTSCSECASPAPAASEGSPCCGGAVQDCTLCPEAESAAGECCAAKAPCCEASTPVATTPAEAEDGKAAPEAKETTPE